MNPHVAQRPPRRRPVSAEAILTAIFVAIGGYVAVEIALAGSPHPTHWIVTVVLALVAFGGAEAIYRSRNPF